GSTPPAAGQLLSKIPLPTRSSCFTPTRLNSIARLNASSSISIADHVAKASRLHRASIQASLSVLTDTGTALIHAQETRCDNYHLRDQLNNVLAVTELNHGLLLQGAAGGCSNSHRMQDGIHPGYLP